MTTTLISRPTPATGSKFRAIPRLWLMELLREHGLELVGRLESIHAEREALNRESEQQTMMVWLKSNALPDEGDIWIAHEQRIEQIDAQVSTLDEDERRIRTMLKFISTQLVKDAFD